MTKAPYYTQVSLGGTEAGLEPQDAWLLWRGALHEWSHLGYGAQRSVASMAHTPVQVLTPASLVAVLKAGFETGLPHESALGPRDGRQPGESQ
jgi:hypothetical protein